MVGTTRTKRSGSICNKKSKRRKSNVDKRKCAMTIIMKTVQRLRQNAYNVEWMRHHFTYANADQKNARGSTIRMENTKKGYEDQYT